MDDRGQLEYVKSVYEIDVWVYLLQSCLLDVQITECWLNKGAFERISSDRLPIRFLG